MRGDYTKSLIVGITGFLITIYTILIGLNIYTIQVHKNALDRNLSRVMEQELCEMYGDGNGADNVNDLLQDMEKHLADSVTLEVRNADFEKGLLSIKAKDSVLLVTGKQRDIVLEKTIIMEKERFVKPMVTITFLLDDEVYKVYQLVEGEVCPMPKPPEGLFAGWIEYGSDNKRPITSIGEVWRDTTFLALTK